MSCGNQQGKWTGRDSRKKTKKINGKDHISMLRLEKITGKNVWDILKLKVSDDQKDFVAGNDTSIIEAYTAITANGYAFPFGICKGDTPVGFLMIGYDVDDDWDDAPEIAGENYQKSGKKTPSDVFSNQPAGLMNSP